MEFEVILCFKVSTELRFGKLLLCLMFCLFSTQFLVMDVVVGKKKVCIFQFLKSTQVWSNSWFCRFGMFMSYYCTNDHISCMAISSWACIFIMSQTLFSWSAMSYSKFVVSIFEFLWRTIVVLVMLIIIIFLQLFIDFPIYILLWVFMIYYIISIRSKRSEREIIYIYIWGLMWSRKLCSFFFVLHFLMSQTENIGFKICRFLWLFWELRLQCKINTIERDQKVIYFFICSSLSPYDIIIFLGWCL